MNPSERTFSVPHHNVVLTPCGITTVETKREINADRRPLYSTSSRHRTNGVSSPSWCTMASTERRATRCFQRLSHPVHAVSQITPLINTAEHGTWGSNTNGRDSHDVIRRRMNSSIEIGGGYRIMSLAEVGDIPKYPAQFDV